MARVTSCVCVSRVAAGASKTLPSRNPANRPGWLRVRRRMPPSISTEARALSQASSWPVSTMPPDLIVTVESDAVPAAAAHPPRVSNPKSACLPRRSSACPCRLRPRRSAAIPSSIRNPRRRCSPRPARPAVCQATRRPSSPWPLRQRQGADAAVAQHHRGGARPPLGILARQQEGAEAARTHPSQPPSLSTRAPAETSSIPLPDSPSASAPAPMRHSVFWPESSTGRRPLVNPDARAIALEDRAVLDFQLPGFVLVDAGLQWRRTVVPGRRTHARRRADFTRVAGVGDRLRTRAAWRDQHRGRRAGARDSSAGTAGARDFGHDRPRPRYTVADELVDVVHIVASEKRARRAMKDALPDMETTLAA